MFAIGRANVWIFRISNVLNLRAMPEVDFGTLKKIVDRLSRFVPSAIAKCYVLIS